MSKAGLSTPITVAPNIEKLVPYVPGRSVEEVQRELGISKLVKLASNENPYGPSPRAQEAIIEEVGKLNIYPDASSHNLKLAMSEFLDVDPECIEFGNGSDDLIHLLGVTFLEEGDEILQGDPSFIRYESAALLNNVTCRMVPLLPDWSYDMDGLIAAINEHTRLVFLANPNNPTGALISHSEVERLLDSLPERAILVLDEAYYEYASEHAECPRAIEWVRQGRNVVVLRTFSKAYGLAGLRIGYGVMRPEIAGWLERTREPFNVNLLAQAGGAAAVADTEFLKSILSYNRLGLQLLYTACDELGLSYTPSYANFLWIDTGQDASEVTAKLLRKGFIVRSSKAFKSSTHIRVTVGTLAETRDFIEVFKSILSS